MRNFLPGAWRHAFVVVLCLWSLGAAAAETARHALVIGNGSYKDAPLANPVNDARAVARALTASGFQVTLKENLDHRAMVQVVREFGDRLRGGGVGLFYFAGHGMQIKGRNFLIPVGAQIEREDEVAYAALDAQSVLDKMDAAHNGTNIVILDACRNNPFARSFRSGAQGLAQMDAPVGTLVAFATAPGSVASDGSGDNGLYTQHLLHALQQPGLKVEEVFKQVRSNVRRDSQGKQVPWESTSLEGDFYFKGPVTAAVTTAPAAASAPTAAAAQPAPAPQAAAPAPQAAAATTVAAYAQRPEAAQRSAGYRVGDTYQFQLLDLYSRQVISQYTNKVHRLLPDGGVELNEGRYVRTAQGGVQREVGGRWTRKDFEGHAALVPAEFRTGYSEPVRYTIHGVRDDGAELLEEYTGTLTVVGRERVKVPAGEFDAWKLERDTKFSGRWLNRNDRWTGTDMVVFWYVPEIGMHVARETTHRAGSAPPERTRAELTKYQRGP